MERRPASMPLQDRTHADRKSTRLNSSHMSNSYAVFCLKKKNRGRGARARRPRVHGRRQPERHHGRRQAGRHGRRRDAVQPAQDVLDAARGRFFFSDTATTEIYTLSLHDALPIWLVGVAPVSVAQNPPLPPPSQAQQALQRSEEHTSELQSHVNLVCRLLLEK